MVSQNQIDDLLAQHTVALVGVSRSGQAFSNRVYRDMKTRGYRVYAVNPNADTIEGEPCYHSVAALPEPVGSALFFTPPAETEKAVREAVAAGVRRLWLQQGAETPEAIRAGLEGQANVVSGECIVMYLAPVRFPHIMHRWVWGLMGKLAR
jgi:predicted CoA-binding protein